MKKSIMFKLMTFGIFCAAQLVLAGSMDTAFSSGNLFDEEAGKKALQRIERLKVKDPMPLL